MKTIKLDFEESKTKRSTNFYCVMYAGYRQNRHRLFEIAFYYYIMHCMTCAYFTIIITIMNYLRWNTTGRNSMPVYVRKYLLFSIMRNPEIDLLILNIFNVR